MQRPDTQVLYCPTGKLKGTGGYSDIWVGYNTRHPNYFSRTTTTLIPVQRFKHPYKLFVLVDIRHQAMESDLGFMTWLGENQVPFAVVFTKSDKLKPEAAELAILKYKEVLSGLFEPLPHIFITSSSRILGKKEILDFIGEVSASWGKL